MVKKFTIPFASQGDANDIPDALQVDGKVSFTQGFGYDYERPYDDPQAKDIAREDMNGLFKAITSAVGELQTLGASEWSSAISYPKGAIVYYEKDLYISQVDDNQSKPPQNWVSITSIANDSLKKAANLSDLTNKTTARSNLGLGSSSTLNKTDVLGTSTSLVATQKLVNDTKINLENSKQDKLTFVGDGKVVREGAYGLGGSSAVYDYDKPSINSFIGGYQSNTPEINSLSISAGATFSYNSTSWAWQIIGSIYRQKVYGRFFTHDDTTGEGKWGDLFEFLTDKNTSTDSSGFLRASGSKETFTKDLISQSTGSSTTNVMSQKAVTDLSFGVGQKWFDVTSQRSYGTTYTNNTGKPIMVVITCTAHSPTGSLIVKVDDIYLTNVHFSNVDWINTVTFIAPTGSTYIVEDVKVSQWSELR